MNKKYWLRTGLVCFGLYIVVGVVSYILLQNCWVKVSGLEGFNCLKYGIPLIIATAPVFEKLNDFLPNSVIFVINGAIWFVAGTFLGWMYEKIKNRKSVSGY